MPSPSGPTAMLVLDVNDIELTLSRDGAVLYAEPGAAVVSPEGVVFGHRAVAQSRLQPRLSHNEFWHRLNADAVAPAGPGVANQADLVYLQLGAMRTAANLRREADLIVATPSATSEGQLALLLGIAGEAGFQVRAIVDAAVAAASAYAPAGAVKVVDVTLHRAVVTELETASSAGAATMRRAGVREVAAAGFAKLLEGWVDAVADRFVEATRFDPLRLAATEQQVLDQVLAAVAADQATAAIEATHDGGSQQVEVHSSVFAGKSAQRYDLLLDAVGGPATVALTHHANQLPGLAVRLAEVGHHVVTLPSGAAATAIAAQSAAIPLATPGASVQLVTELPARGGAPVEQPVRAVATHLLCGHLAVPIAALADASEHPACLDAAPLFRLRQDDDGLAVLASGAATVSVNGERLARPRLVAAGDEVRAGEHRFVLIAVADAGG